MVVGSVLAAFWVFGVVTGAFNRLGVGFILAILALIVVFGGGAWVSLRELLGKQKK